MHETQSLMQQMQRRQASERRINNSIIELHNQTASTVDDYLLTQYEDGYIGAQYRIIRQGVPVATPLNGDVQVFAISRPMGDMTYTNRLDRNTNNYLRTARNVILGAAAGLLLYECIRRITRASAAGLNSAARIVRTEGGRATSQGKFEAMQRAKDRGADVKKQWDSTLDGKTRPSHQTLDQQIREVDEEFISGLGNTAMYPRGFGVKQEDINCRCVLLQRAAWAMDDESYERMAEVGGIKTLVNARNYEEFKKGHFEVARQVDNQAQQIIRETQLQRFFRG